MALDDPIVWMLIFAVVIFLFGSSKLPQIARTLGQARREFDTSWRGITGDLTGVTGSAPIQQTTPGPQPVTKPATPIPPTAAAKPLPGPDPLIVACKNEGIETVGKSREQLATELATKLNKQ